MVQLNTPDALIKEAQKYGVTLQPKVSYDPQAPLLEVSAQFHGEEYVPEGLQDDFGSLFGSVLRKVGLKKAQKKLGKQIATQAAPNDKARQAEIASMFTKMKPKLDVKETIKGNLKILGAVAKVASNPTSVTSAFKSIASAPKAITSFNIPKNVNPARALASADKFLGSQGTPANIRQQVINNTKAMAALGDPNAKRAVTTLNAAQQIRIATQTPAGKSAIDAKPLPLSTVKKEQSKAKVIQLAQKADAKLTKKGWWPRFKEWIFGEKK